MVHERLRSLTSAHPAVSYELQVALPDGSRRWHEWTDRGDLRRGGPPQRVPIGRSRHHRAQARRAAGPLSGAARSFDRSAQPRPARGASAVRAGPGAARSAPIAVLLLDLDGFKRVNDTLGHLVGDRLLRAVGERLRHNLRASDVVARFGGDEFAVVQTAIERPARRRGVDAQAARRSGAAVRVWAARPCCSRRAAASPLFPDHGATPEALIEAADLALYRAKGEGRSKLRLFAPEMEARASQRRCLERDLRTALERGELELFYQPRIDLREDRSIGGRGARALAPPGTRHRAAAARSSTSRRRSGWGRSSTAG